MISGLRIVSTFHCRLQTTNKQKSNRQRKPRKEENIKLLIIRFPDLVFHHQRRSEKSYEF